MYLSVDVYDIEGSNVREGFICTREGSNVRVGFMCTREDLYNQKVHMLKKGAYVEKRCICEKRVHM